MQGNPHVRFDEQGVETGRLVSPSGEPHDTAPPPDSNPPRLLRAAGRTFSGGAGSNRVNVSGKCFVTSLFNKGGDTLKLQQLRHVLAVFERGSLRNAAEQLGLAQPAMSRSIRELEQELGVELFERSHAGMKLTPIGSLFIRRAQAIQAEVGRTLREIEEVRDAGYGALTVGFSTAAHLALMPEMLAPFHLRFPRTRLRVVEGLLPTMEANLRSGTVDLYYGAVPANFNPGSLEVESLFENPRIVIARPDHSLSRATSIKELLDASWVTTPVVIDTDNEVNTLFEFAGLPLPWIALEAESGMSIFTAVANTDLLAPSAPSLAALHRGHRIGSSDPLARPAKRSAHLFGPPIRRAALS